MLSENNVIEKLSDERYARMSADYEAEQKELLTKIDECERLLSEAEQKNSRYAYVFATAYENLRI